MKLIWTILQFLMITKRKTESEEKANMNLFYKMTDHAKFFRKGDESHPDPPLMASVSNIHQSLNNSTPNRCADLFTVTKKLSMKK